MPGTRRYILFMMPVLAGIFSLMVFVSQIAGTYQTETEYSILDFEDPDSSEESKPLKLIEDYNLHHDNVLSLQKSYLLNSVQYRKFAVEHSLEVFIEVVTPPPEV